MADKSYHELIDEEQKIVEKTELPQIDARRAFNGILWILKSGLRGDSCLKNTVNSVYKKFRHWTEAGVFEKLTQSKAECGEILILDSTFSVV